jgi:hypothetical protein
MRRTWLSGVAVGAFVGGTAGQVPPSSVRVPDRLPPSVTAPPPTTGYQPGPSAPKAAEGMKPGLSSPSTVGTDGLPLPRPDVPLVRGEAAKPLGKIEIKFVANNWQVWAGPHVFANFGSDWKSAEKTGQTLMAMQTGDTGKATIGDVQTTAWETLGATRPVVGYMTSRGDVIRTFRGSSNTAVGLDLTTARVESVRGAWVVRDSRAIHLNFGEDRGEAEQALAVARRYGFNRIGYVGPSESPSLRYFFSAPDAGLPVVPANALTTAMQEYALDRTGVDVPGLGTVGQKVNLDVRKIDVRKDGADYVVGQGGDVLARFGRDEWSARDALRAVQQLNPTAVVRIGTPGVMFFLAGAEPPNRLPFGTMGAPFDPDRLTIRPTLDGVHHLYDPLGREIASAKTKDEAEAIRLAVKHFKLNRQCQIGRMPGQSLLFLGRAQ